MNDLIQFMIENILMEKHFLELENHLILSPVQIEIAFQKTFPH